MFNKEKVKLGIAPIGWCNDDMPELITAQIDDNILSLDTALLRAAANLHTTNQHT